MATTIESNLYPPIVDTFMPAFLYTEHCKVYFDLTDYNEPEDIKQAHVSLVYQTTNKNALSSQYKNGLKICEVKTEGNRYYIELEPNDLLQPIEIAENTKGFELNTFYKVQIRFSGVDASDKTVVTDTGWSMPAYWYSDNLNKFSEWSTICILKAISPPQINLKANNINLDTNNTSTVESNNIVFTGLFSYDITLGIDSETLSHYNLTLEKNNDKIKSDEIYTNRFANPNEINYTFNKRFENGTYKLIFNYTTINNYTQTLIYNFNINVSKGSLIPGGAISALLDAEDGRIKVKISSDSNFTLPIVIFRSCIDTDFEVWEKIYEFTNTSVNEFIWYDYTAEGGKFYKYSASTYDIAQHLYGTEIVTEEPVILIYDDIFFTANDIQLKVSYNQTLNSYKPTIAIGKVDTIGSKYPFIRKNGNMNYKNFSISGIVSCISDENQLFMTDEEMYYNTNGVSLYKNYNLNNGITPLNDYIAEKRFRDKVIDFLSDAKVKLFRSLTEGNILVKITDVSLTPNQSLGRRIWTFSATCVEVDDAILDNYFKYEIQSQTGTTSAIDNNIIFNRNGSSMAHSIEVVRDSQNNIISETYLDVEIDKEILKNDSNKDN